MLSDWGICGVHIYMEDTDICTVCLEGVCMCRLCMHVRHTCRHVHST